MTFGGFGPKNLLELAPNPEASVAAVRVQLLAVSASCIAGVGILVVRRLRTGRPLRRSLALLVDAREYLRPGFLSSVSASTRSRRV